MESVSLAGITTASKPIVLYDQDAILFANGSVIQMIQISSGKLLGSFIEHEDIVTSISLSYERHLFLSKLKTIEQSQIEENLANPLIISTSFDGQVYLWDLKTFSKIKSFNCGSPILKANLINNSSSDNSLSLFLTISSTSNTIEDIETKKSKMKVHVSIEVYEPLTFKKKNDLNLKLSSNLIDYISFPLSNQNKKSTLMSSSLIYAKNKKLYFHPITNHSNNLVKESDNTLSSDKPCVISFSQDIEVMAVNSMNGLIAVGLENGEIVVLHHVDQFLSHFFHEREIKESLLTKTTLQWHAHSVLTLTFSTDGKVLYSGGEESVLVVWNLNKLSKSFLPRLGAPICNLISPNQHFQFSFFNNSFSSSAKVEGKILISCLDNSLRWINTSNMEIEWYWQTVNISYNKHQSSSSSFSYSSNNSFFINKIRENSLKFIIPSQLFNDFSDKNFNFSLQISPINNNIMTNNTPGYLQSYDIITKTLKKSLKVLYFNYVSKKDKKSKIFLPTISFFQYDLSGYTLVTVDSKRGEEFSAESSLKFWEFNEITNDYSLSGQINSPHGDDNNITCLDIYRKKIDFNKENDLIYVATGSSDGLVKIWLGKYEDEFELNTNKTKKVLRWSTSSSFQYRKTSLDSLAWSRDGSILSLCHDNLVSFWDPISVTLKKSFSLTPSNTIPSLSNSVSSIINEYYVNQYQNVLMMKFIEPRFDLNYGGGSSKPYFIIITTSECILYDVFTLKPVWIYGSSSSTLSTNSPISNLASFSITACNVASSEKNIVLLKPEERLNIDEEGWIALAISQPVLNDENKIISKKNKIIILSPSSSTPIFEKEINTKITSISFINHIKIENKNENNKYSIFSGLIVSTSDSELLSIYPSNSQYPLVSTNMTVAMVHDSTLPVFITNEETDGEIKINNNLLNETLKTQNSGIVTKKMYGNSNFFSSFLPDNSDDLPKISDISNEFLMNLSATCPKFSYTKKSDNKSSDFAEDDTQALKKRSLEIAGHSIFSVDEEEAPRIFIRKQLDVDVASVIVSRKLSELINKGDLDVGSKRSNLNSESNLVSNENIEKKNKKSRK